MILDVEDGYLTSLPAQPLKDSCQFPRVGRFTTLKIDQEMYSITRGTVEKQENGVTFVFDSQMRPICVIRGHLTPISKQPQLGRELLLAEVVIQEM